MEIAIDRAIVAEEEKGGLSDAKGDFLPAEWRKGTSHPDLSDGREGRALLRQAQDAQGIADGEQGSGLFIAFADRSDALVFAVRRQAVLVEAELGIAAEGANDGRVGPSEAFFCGGGTVQRELLS